MKFYQTPLFPRLAAVAALAILAAPASAAQMPWDVHTVESKDTPILNVTDALALLNGQIEASGEANGQYSVVNFNLKQNPRGGLFGNDTTNQLLQDMRADPDGSIPLVVRPK